jgi:hypothetical protein
VDAIADVSPADLQILLRRAAVPRHRGLSLENDAQKAVDKPATDLKLPQSARVCPAELLGHTWSELGRNKGAQWTPRSAASTIIRPASLGIATCACGI